MKVLVTGGAGYIGLPDVNSPFRGWKITMFEGGLRVPMFIKWPGRIPAGTSVDTPVAHIDVSPTLAAAAGAALPVDVEIDGVNLLPLATGDAVENWERETLFWQNGHYQVVRHGDWKLQVNDRPTDGLQQWLYNLADDPTEQRNLASSRPDKLRLVGRVDVLVARLKPLHQCLVDHHRHLGNRLIQRPPRTGLVLSQQLA